LREANYPDVVQALDWSFYSQGQHEYATDSQRFLDEAVRHFGLTLDPEDRRHADQTGQKVAEVFVREGGIILLDGVEPLQFPPEINRGELKDNGLKAFLTSLRYAPSPQPGQPPRLLVLTAHPGRLQRSTLGDVPFLRGRRLESTASRTRADEPGVRNQAVCGTAPWSEPSRGRRRGLRRRR